MKTRLMMLVLISTSLLKLQSISAQEMPPKTENSINTTLDFPIPKRVFDTERGEYAAFTMAQYSQLIHIYNAYLTLADIASVQLKIILNLEFQVGQQYKKILLMDELLNEKNRVLKRKNGNFDTGRRGSRRRK